MVKAILPEEFAGFDPSTARLLEAMNLGDGGRTMGYLVDAGEPILLVDQNAVGDHTFRSPDGPPTNRVRVFTGMDQTWRDAQVTGSTITVRLSQGVHLVRGLPPDVRVWE